MPKITPDITEEAFQIYKNLPKHIKKNDFLSDAIIEKHSREQTGGYVTLEQHTQDIVRLQKQIDRLKKAGE